MNVLLVSASIEGANHTYLCLSWLAKAYIWEYGFDGLYSRLYTFILPSSHLWRVDKDRSLHMDFPAGSCFQVLEKRRYCIYSHKCLYNLANPGYVTHPAFAPFLVPQAWCEWAKWSHQKYGYRHICSLFSYDRADVTVTDLPDFVELMSTNIDLNKESIQGSVTARALVW